MNSENLTTNGEAISGAARILNAAKASGVMVCDESKCDNCGRCAAVCRAQGMVTARMADGCLRCGRCADACPTGAIGMREHIDEILSLTHDRDTTTAAMLCGCVRRGLQALCGEKFTYEQIAAAVQQLGVDHVYSPGWAKAESLKQAADILDRELGKNRIIMTDNYAAKAFLQEQFPQLRDRFRFYDSMQTLFGRLLRAQHPDWKLLNISRHNGFAAEGADTGLVDSFVSTPELFHILERTGIAPHRAAPVEPEEIAPYEKETRYAELLDREGWKPDGDPEEICFRKDGKTYKTVVCHNLAQTALVLQTPEQYDVIRVIG